jgi:hypothetical protein
MFLKATCLGKIQGSKWRTEAYPIFPHTNPEVPGCCGSFPIQHCAFFGAPSYEELVKTVNNVLDGHMLRKNPREQMTNREILHFFHTQTQRSQRVAEAVYDATVPHALGDHRLKNMSACIEKLNYRQ